jgi:drug/metabolite transporter (DMT)-like permease
VATATTTASRPALGTHAILLAAQVCFASLAVVGRLALTDHGAGHGKLPPAGIVLVRMAGGAIAFAVIAWRRGVLRMAWRDVPYLVLCSFLGIAANQELFLQGLARSTATNASVLGATIPVFTALCAIALRHEPARPRRLLGIAVAFGGAVALVGAGGVSTSSDHLLGSAMVLANSCCYGVFLVIVRPLAARYDPIALLAYLFAIGVPMVAPLGIAAWAGVDRALDATDVAYLAFLIVVPTLGAYGFVQTALRRAEASLVAAYIYLQPLFATLGAMLLLDEQPTARLAACGAVILCGVWLATRAPRARAARPS